MEATQFLQSLFENSSNFIEIRELGSKGNRQHFLRPEEVDQYTPPQDTNVYFGLYGRAWKQGTAASCTTTRTLWADYDHMTQAEVISAIEAAGLPYPSQIVSSGNGIHAYWILDKPAGDEALPVVKAIVEATGADPRATDKARILRLPGTNNMKAEPKPCKTLEYTGERFSLEDFPKQEKKRERVESTAIKGLKIDRPCIANMLKGVREGHRNFVLGRITKYFQLKGLDKRRAWEEVKKWNTRNEPPENTADLKSAFNAYWAGEYKLLGCVIEAQGLQDILSEYCEKENCSVNNSLGKLKLRQSVAFNNILYTHIKSLTGYELMIYGLLLMYPEGVKSDRLSQIRRQSMTEKRMIKALEVLKAKGLITIDGRLKSQGAKRRYFVKAKPQGTFGTGYTSVPNGAIRGAVDKRITPAEFKLYTLLLKYSYGKDTAFPSITTLSKDLGIKRSATTEQLKALEDKLYINRVYDGTGSAITELLG